MLGITSQANLDIQEWGGADTVALCKGKKKADLKHLPIFVVDN